MSFDNEKCSGVITLFLTLCFTMILSILFVTIESARVQAMKCYTEGLSQIAMQSALGYFCLPLYQDYGIFAADTTCDEMTFRINENLQENLHPTKNLSDKYFHFFPVKNHSLESLKMYRLTDENGEIFADEIISLMKYVSLPVSMEFLLDSDFIDNLQKDYVDFSKIDLENEEYLDTSYQLDDFKDITDEKMTDADETAETSMEETVEKDEESIEIKKSIFTKMKDLTNHPSLTLYVQNPADISANQTDTAILPSKTCHYDKTHTINHLSKFKEKLQYLLYLYQYFHCYTNTEQEDVLQYQLEYILGGKNADDENLSHATSKLQELRTGLNLAYLYTDTAKRSEARALSTAAVGWLAIPFLVEFTQLALLSAWAYVEGILDIRTLLDGGKIPLIKSAATWSVDLKEILILDSSKKACSSEQGLSYEQYLLLLLYRNLNTEVIYRTMDLIQMNMQKNYKAEFHLSSCYTGMKYAFTFDFLPLFYIPGFYQKNSVFSHNFIQSFGY